MFILWVLGTQWELQCAHVWELSQHQDQSLQLICVGYTEIKISDNKRMIEFVFILCVTALLFIWTFSFTDSFPYDVSWSFPPFGLAYVPDKKNPVFSVMNCPIQRSIVVSCITSHLPCHPELKGTCFTVICQPFWADPGCTCNVLVLSFLVSAGNWLPAPWLPNRTSLLGTSSSHWNDSQALDGVWWAGDICPWPRLLSLGSSLHSQAEEKPSWAGRAVLICSAEPGSVCSLPFVLPGKELCTHRHGSAACWKPGSKLPSLSRGQNIPACAGFNNCWNERSSRELCRDLGVCAHVWVIY